MRWSKEARTKAQYKAHVARMAAASAAAVARAAEAASSAAQHQAAASGAGAGAGAGAGGVGHTLDEEAEVKAELKELQQQIEADSPPDVRAFAHDVGVFGEALDHDLDVGLRALDKRAAPIVHAAEQDSAAELRKEDRWNAAAYHATIACLLLAAVVAAWRFMAFVKRVVLPAGSQWSVTCVLQEL